jgi:hypothetical protein
MALSLLNSDAMVTDVVSEIFILIVAVIMIVWIIGKA